MCGILSDLNSKIKLEFVVFVELLPYSTCQDKWRNLSVTASGWGSREKARLALKRSLKNSKHDDNSTATFTVDQGFDDQGVDDEIVDAKPLAMSSEPLMIEGPKRSFSRLFHSCNAF